MVEFQKTKSVQPRQGNETQKTAGTREVTQRDEKKVGREIAEKKSNIFKLWSLSSPPLSIFLMPIRMKVRPLTWGSFTRYWEQVIFTCIISNNINENSFQVLFFIVCVLVEIFANVSGISLIILFWRTDFLFTHAIYIVGCKVGGKRAINHIKQVLSNNININENPF